MKPPLPPFSPSFIFGTGTSDHQCEAFDPRYPDIWDRWEAEHAPGTPGVIPYQARGRATDFWDRYHEDIRLAAELGCTAFRFSIAWARVEPEPGCFSEEALQHYRAVAQAVVDAGMEPVVTLMHFVWPLHVETRGGLRAGAFPDWFEAYAARVREVLGDLCRYWITINEPNALLFGFLKPFWMRRYAWPPGLPPGTSDEETMWATAEVIRNLFLAHRAARRALRDGPGGEQRLVSANSYYLGLPSRWWRIPLPLMQWVDWRATSEKGWSEEDWALVERRIVLRSDLAPPKPPSERQDGRQPNPGPIVVAQLASLSRAAASLFGAAKIFAVISSFTASNWWQLGMRGRLPEFLCPPECVGELDFVAFDYYFGTKLLNQLTRLLDVIQRRYDRAPISATGLYDALHYFADMFPEYPLFVIENGFIGNPRGWRRARHLHAHLEQVQRAAADGLNVVGYLAWSLTTNREWGLPATPASDFGLYHVDLDHDPALKRHRTPLGQMYERIIRRRRA